MLDPALARDFVAMRDRIVERLEGRREGVAGTPPLSDCVFDD